MNVLKKITRFQNDVGFYYGLNSAVTELCKDTPLYIKVEILARYFIVVSIWFGCCKMPLV